MDETRTQPPLRSGEIADADDFVSLPSGYALARYKLVETLGQGTFGITYRALDAQLNRTVAIKEYLPVSLAVRHGGTQVLPRSTRLADDFRWGRDRFLSEAQTLAQFENVPAVVRVYDFLEANGTAYMVMELLRGETLEARLKRDGRLAAEVVERLLHPLLDGLERVHATGILHRDIKPSNIILDAEGRPTLLDFGAARAAIAGRTQAMTAVYTPGYAAAEQFTSAGQGPYTDIYGLAATLYQCVTGTMPPTALERLMDDRLVPASRAAAGQYAKKLLAGIDAGMALKAQDRPPTIAAWRSQFTGGRATARAPAIVPDAEASATRVSRHAPTPGAPHRGARRWVMAAVAVLVLSGVVAGGYLYVRDAEQRAVAERERVETERRAAEAKARAETEARERALEAQRRAEEERIRAEAARRQVEEDARRRAGEEEARRQAQMESEAEDRRQDEARRLAAEEARRTAEADARRRQEEEARRLAADEGRRKAESEARRHQEEEARRIAAEEARRKAEADARRPQVDEARLKAEAEARRRQEEEARRRAADEARRKAEADARRPQEEAARRPAGGVDGTWSGTVECFPGGPKGALTLRVAGGRGGSTVEGMKISLRLSESSAVADLAWIGSDGREYESSLRGSPSGDTISITGSARTVGGRADIRRPQCFMKIRRQ